MPEILSGFDISVKKKTAKHTDGIWNNNMYPVQFVSDKEKGIEWSSATMNWIEFTGMKQLTRNLNWMSRNYQLANNQIDKRDYIRDKDNEYFDLVNRLTDENSATELRSVPFIQLIVNSLCNEYDKRPPKISFSLLDDTSMDEMFEDKERDIEEILLMQASMKQQNSMLQKGISPESEEGQQMMNPEQLKSLPELQNFYNSSYRSMYQEWAEHQMIMDNDRFYMDEQKRLAFKDSLVADRSFWEIMMKKDDYEVRRWNPKQVFYRKSPNERWIQNGQWAGYLTLMNVPDVLDSYGWMMSEEQQELLNQFYPARSASWSEDGLRPEGMWDSKMPYSYNRTGPGIAARQLYSALGFQADGTGDVVNQLVADSEDIIDSQWSQLVRVCTTYWKTQRHIYELTRIDEDGNMTRDLVSDSYVVTVPPVYNTLIYKEKTSENLVYGEHLDGIWINEVWGGVKIGPNLPVYGYSGQNGSFSPMFLGIRGGIPGKLPYQFRGDKEKWNPMLPVCGAVFNDNNVHSRSLVDTLKIYQIGVNMTANQMLDLMVDELGIIINFDPTSLPRHSMGEDWGPDPFPKAIQVMRDFSILPTVRQIAENGQVTNPDNVKVLDASQSQRFITKMKLHQFFMESGLNAVGMNPQRLGQTIDSIDTATGIEQAQSNSFSSTEHLFTQFDELMVRLHSMRTDCARYYNSTNPSVRLQYTTSAGMKQWFMMDGRNLSGREIGVRCISSPHSRHVLEEIKRMVLKNNTTDTSLSDLIRLYKSETLADIDPIIKSIERKSEQNIQGQRTQEQQMQQQQQEASAQLEQQRLQNENEQKQLDRENKLNVAQIMVSPKIADAGIIEDNTAELSQNQLLHNEKMNFEKQKEFTKTNIEQQKIQLAKQKLQEESKRTSVMSIANKAKPAPTKNKK